MDLDHLAWPFFDSACVEFAEGFDRWASAELGKFEQNEGGDGVAARQIFERLANGDWLRATLPTQTSGRQERIGLRHVSLMREIAAYSSAIADVALSEPWLGILPIALYGSPDLRDELLPRYIAGRLLPAFALSEPDAGSDAAAITTTARRDGDHYVINGRKTWTSNCGLGTFTSCLPGWRSNPAPAESRHLRSMVTMAASRLRRAFRSCHPIRSERGPSRIAGSPRIA